MTEHGYLQIRNWKKFQNADVFKKSGGKPPWVKFYVHKDIELEQLPLEARLLFYELLKVSGRYANAFLSDIEWLVGEVRMPSSVIAEMLPLLIQGAWLSETKTPRRSRIFLDKPLETFSLDIDEEEEKKDLLAILEEPSVDKSEIEDRKQELIDRILAGCVGADKGTRTVLAKQAVTLDLTSLADVAVMVERQPRNAGTVVELLKRQQRAQKAKAERHAGAVASFLENLGPAYAHDAGTFAEEYVRVAGPTEASVVEKFRLACLTEVAA